MVNNGTPSLWVMQPRLELKTKVGRVSTDYQHSLTQRDAFKDPEMLFLSHLFFLMLYFLSIYSMISCPYSPVGFPK